MKYFRVFTVLILFGLVACGDISSPLSTSTVSATPTSQISTASPSVANVSPAVTTGSVSPSSPVASTTTSVTTPPVTSSPTPTAFAIHDGTTAPPATASLQNLPPTQNACTATVSDDPGAGNLAFRCATSPQPGHSNTIHALAYSPDGKYFVSIDDNGENVKLWQAADGKLLQTFFLVAGFSPDELRFSTDSARLYGVDTSHFSDQHYFLFGWDLTTRQVILRMVSFPGDYTYINISPDLKTIVTFKAYTGPNVAVWDAATGKQTGTIKAAPDGSVVLEAVFSPDSKLIAVGGDFKSVSLWIRDTLKQTGELKTTTSGLALQFSPDAKSLLVGDFSSSGSYELWNVAASQKVGDMGAFGFSAPYVFTPDSRNLIMGDQTANKVKFWDTATGKLVRTLPGQGYNISALAISPDAKKLLVGTTQPDSSLTIRDLNTPDGNSTLTIKGVTEPPYSVALSPDGNLLAVGPFGKSATLWNFNNYPIYPQYQITLDPKYGSGVITAFSPDGRFLAIVGGFGGVRMLDVTSGQETGNFGSLNVGLSDLAFSPDGKFLAVSEDTGLLELFTVNQGILTEKADLLKANEAAPFHQPGPAVFKIAFSPDSKFLAAASEDKTVKMWDLQDKILPLVRTFDKHAAPVRSLAFSKDGSLVASGDEAGNLKIWESATGQEKFTIQQPNEPINFLAFSKNENFIIATTEIGRLKMWDIAANPPKSYSTNDVLIGGGIRDAALSSDRRWLVTIHADGSIQKWEVIG